MGIFKDVYNSMFKKDLDPSLFDDQEDARNGWRNNGLLTSSSNKEIIFKDLVYRCIDIIAMKVASNEYYFKNGNKDLDVYKAEELDAFANPNSFNTFFDIMYATTVYSKLYGVAFWYCPRYKQSKTRARIYCLNPKGISLVLNTDKATQMTKPIKEYVYVNGNEKIVFTPEEIVPFFKFNINGTLGGVGEVDYLFETIKENKYIQVYTNSFFENNARPDYVLEAPESIDEKTGKTILDNLRTSG
jgi:phage portal protein BeeE